MTVGRIGANPGKTGYGLTTGAATQFYFAAVTRATDTAQDSWGAYGEVTASTASNLRLLGALVTPPDTASRAYGVRLAVGGAGSEVPLAEIPVRQLYLTSVGMAFVTPIYFNVAPYVPSGSRISVATVNHTDASAANIVVRVMYCPEANIA